MVATIRSISSASNAGKYFYFTERNFECTKEWHNSRGKELLGLDDLTRESFENILNGKLQVNDEEIQLGRKVEDGIAHHPGQEIVLSPPKSVSIMALVANDNRLVEAHEKAVSEVLEYIEKNMVYTRVQRNGKITIEKTDNCIVARFTHLTSRPSKAAEEDKRMPDPQLHTHAIIGNATRCEDGQWRSIVFDRLYENKMHIGEVYRMALARSVEGCGYGIELMKDRSNHWTFEIAGVSDKIIKTFSTRRKDILAMAEELGKHGAENLAQIAKATRGEKIGYSMGVLQEHWGEKAAPYLTKLESLKTKKMELQISEVNLDKIFSYAVSYLSEREAVFSKEQLIGVITSKVCHKVSIEKIKEAIEEAVKSGKLLGTYDKSGSHFTTVKAKSKEARCMELFRNNIGKSKAVMTKEEITGTLRNTGLTTGQQDAVILVLGSKDRVVGIQGSAGTGKTTVLKTIKSLAESKEYSLLGIAPTKSAAFTIQNDTGIKAQTLHSLLAKYDGVIAGRGTQAGRNKMRDGLKNKIVVLDEASLASTDHLIGLLKLSSTLNFKLVMLGDIRQLGAVEAGKPFNYLQDHGMNTVLMQDIKRQRHEALLSSVHKAEDAVDKVGAYAAKALEKSLELIGEQNIITIDKEGESPLNERLSTASYGQWAEYKAKGIEALLVVPSNPLRRMINSEIRKHYVTGNGIEHTILTRRDLRKVEMGEVESYKPPPIAKGDSDRPEEKKEIVVLFNKEDGKYGIKGGEYFDVIDKIGKTRITLARQGSKERIIVSVEDLGKKRRGVIEIFEKDKLALGVGEKIRWTKNSKEHSFIINGGSAKIHKIENNEITVETGDEGLKSLNLKSNELQHIDHDYTHTAYSAQGKTADYVIGVARAREGILQLTTQRSFYVAVSRAREEAKLVIDDRDKLLRALGARHGAKTSAIEHRREVVLKDFPVPLSNQRREVWIDKSGNNTSKTPEQNNVRVPCGHANTTNKPDLELMYQDFMNNPGAMREIACEIFGDINPKLSKNNKLRFGNKGGVSVNLETGQWHNFEAVEGGSLFKFYKEKNQHNYNRPTFTKVKQAKTEVVKTKRNIGEFISKSVDIGHKSAELGRRYLGEHRKIDVNNINYSQDLRYMERAWSSETKTFYPALIAASRSKDGEIVVTQCIYLDPKTSNKNKNLDIAKRSIGALKGSYVELTNNKTANIIFIAEGIETALTMAQAYPEARVLCSLGISNIQNIDLSGESNIANKKVIICGDNDGQNSATRMTIDRAAGILQERGIKSVSIIRPDIDGQDFNDVVKIRGTKGVKLYLDPILRDRKNYGAKFRILSDNIKFHKAEEQRLQRTLCLDVYRDQKGALSLWDSLVREKGIIQAMKEVVARPQILGKLHGIDFLVGQSVLRTKALAELKCYIAYLVKIQFKQKIIELNEKQLHELKNDFTNQYLNEISNIKTSNLDLDAIKQGLEKHVLHTLYTMDGAMDYKTVKSVVNRTAEQIFNYRQRYQKEAGVNEKREFFLRARFEASRRGKIEQYLRNHCKTDTVGDRLIFEQKLERLLAIDSKTANKDSPYYTGGSIKEVCKTFKHGELRISSLTKDHMAREMPYTKANFIATETVKYEEKYGVHMPLKQFEYLKTVGDYVNKNFHILTKQGFTEKEARIVYNEGATLLKKYDIKVLGPNLTKSEIMDVQKESKQQFSNLNTNNAGIKSNEGVGRNVELEI